MSTMQLQVIAPRKVCEYVVNNGEGRVTQAGLVGNVRDVKSSRQPLRPDEVLFKQANAPVRYEETDYYNAHTRLPGDQRLPDGELLAAIHAYVSKLYSRTTEGDSQPAWKCMDETALIAFGILMEETAREVLGETGDFAFVEAADEEEERIFGQGSEDEKNDTGSFISRDVSQEASAEADSESSSDYSRVSTEDSD
ncbi:uncharacterized protein M421DRAFT_124581 [Didymella exigua CBS 183.55]|uniref:Uncharacterized protein n=1 Tax=Didymella exigua CBS 183.55 TaxID=1150837 RepID=A0A6A5RMF8_9PLEO|nr:uncharacterized protein M421DRAFT_124581 [Didymella exigua CBS 183.55]KAF1929591.1 hypothetical protein M421DRAFT_124581 [Didymella exigua CBS 183.55]